MGEPSGVGPITVSVGGFSAEDPCTLVRIVEVLDFEGGGDGVCVREGELKGLPPLREEEAEFSFPFLVVLADELVGGIMGSPWDMSLCRTGIFATFSDALSLWLGLFFAV
jgi:hypothetical protein